jgi:deoxyribodipyrimidine photo-lyase
MKHVTSSIWWIRRDLRLTDNHALAAALASAERVIPAFILDPALLQSPYLSPKRLAFLLDGLRRLDADLQARGGRLAVRRGEPQAELARLLAESRAQAIFAESDCSPYARRRDARVAESLPLHLLPGPSILPPGSVLKADGTPYTVFTPFSRAWKAHASSEVGEISPAPNRIVTPSELTSLPLPDQPALPRAIPFTPGEAEAKRRLALFLEGNSPPIYAYADTRNRLDLVGTSELSPYLRFGMLSARQAELACRRAIDASPSPEAREGSETWLNELIWREFYIHILYHFPQVRERSFRPEFQAIPWANDETDFAAWCHGRTGYPVVDAAMRQLAQSGWMHNRARMVVASFLVKDLLIDWRWGEHWFMQHLVDGDPAANNGGWQWSAGTGTDAVPYFRIFNPVLQGRKFDPSGEYVRRWLPELARVPDKFLHMPSQMPAHVQQAAGCLIGHDYPQPVIDHNWARQRALAAYDQARSGRADLRPKP